MRLPKRDFAVKRGGKGGRGKYPIYDRAHARNALARVSQFGTAAQKKEVRAAVHRRYPGLGVRRSRRHRARRLA